MVDLLGVLELGAGRSGRSLLRELRETVRQMLKENGLGDVMFLVGGTIPDEDAERLKQLGVAEVFGPGTPTGAIVDYIKKRT